MMDSNITHDIINNISQNGLYDILKFTLLFVVYKSFEHFYLKQKWGGWHVKILKGIVKDEKEIVNRELSIQAIKRILEDKGEFSIYVKGIVSPYAYLNIDIASDEAEKIGLITKNSDKKEIIVDLSKNPKKKKPIEFTEKTQQQIDEILNIVKSSQKEVNF